MRRLAPFIVIAALGVSLLLGWLNPSPTPPPSSAVRGGRAPVLSTYNDPNGETRAVIERIRPFLAGPPPLLPASGGDSESAPPAKAAPPLPPTPTPPPPDVAVVFRTRVSALLRQPDNRLAVVLVDSSGETRQTKTLNVGDVFMGPWRLAALTPNEAVLANGRMERRVPLFGRGVE